MTKEFALELFDINRLMSAQDIDPELKYTIQRGAASPAEGE